MDKVGHDEGEDICAQVSMYLDSECYRRLLSPHFKV